MLDDLWLLGFPGAFIALGVGFWSVSLQYTTKKNENVKHAL